MRHSERGFLNLQKGIIASFYILIPVFIIGESCYNYILHIIKYLIKYLAYNKNSIMFAII